MPEIKYYTVTETREVVVTANNEIDAISIAHAAFKNGQNTDYGVINGPETVWGNTLTKIDFVSLSIKEQ